MDSRGRAYDNIFTEQLWWAVEYEDIFMHEYHDIPACRLGLEQHLRFYNESGIRHRSTRRRGRCEGRSRVEQ